MSLIRHKLDFCRLFFLSLFFALAQNLLDKFGHVFMVDLSRRAEVTSHKSKLKLEHKQIGRTTI